jgi:hypothetical protein
LGFFLGCGQIEANLPKILHISFHRGCIREIEAVATNLGWNLTSLYVQEHLPKEQFDGVTKNNGIYNITAKRAKNIWNRHRAYFNQFDVIITSDTAPLSRIFLQNNYHGKLIIWVCNRFDYYDKTSAERGFPDQAYYDLLSRATHNSKVKFIAYNEFEAFYALNKKLDIGNMCIKPCGFSWGSQDRDHKIAPTDFFIPPYINNQNLGLLKICKQQQIPAVSFEYDGPEHLKNAKGIINIPGAWSNFALFENLANGVPYFAPSKKFMLHLLENGAWMPNGNFAKDYLHLSEWYNPEMQDVIVYFDSWDDLKHKIDSSDFMLLKNRCRAFANNHKIKMLKKWQKLIY